MQIERVGDIEAQLRCCVWPNACPGFTPDPGTEGVNVPLSEQEVQPQRLRREQKDVQGRVLARCPAHPPRDPPGVGKGEFDPGLRRRPPRPPPHKSVIGIITNSCSRAARCRIPCDHWCAVAQSVIPRPISHRRHSAFAIARVALPRVCPPPACACPLNSHAAPRPPAAPRRARPVEAVPPPRLCVPGNRSHTPDASRDAGTPFLRPPDGSRRVSPPPSADFRLTYCPLTSGGGGGIDCSFSIDAYHPQPADLSVLIGGPMLREGRGDPLPGHHARSTPARGRSHRGGSAGSCLNRCEGYEDETNWFSSLTA